MRPSRSFRYAPLSDGLNIIRKTLGQHEIVTLQSTSVDQTAGLIRLNTVYGGAMILASAPLLLLGPKFGRSAQANMRNSRPARS